MSFILIKTLKMQKHRNLIPIGRLEFRSEFHIFDRNYGFSVENPIVRSPFFLTFNYKKVHVKTKFLQSHP